MVLKKFPVKSRIVKRSLEMLADELRFRYWVEKVCNHLH